VRSAHAALIAAVCEPCHGFGVPAAVHARVAALEAEQRVALDWARAHAPELHTRVAVALAFALTDTGRSREAYEEIGVAIEREGIAAGGGMAALIRAFASPSVEARAAGPPLIAAGLTAVRSTGDDARLELGLRLAGFYWLGAGDPERSLEHLTAALALARRRGTPADLFTELYYHASALAMAGRLEEAERSLDEAAPLVPQVGGSEAGLGDVRALIAVARGDWALAARLTAESATTAGRNLGGLGWLLLFTAIALAHVGADEDALELEACAYAIAELIGAVVDDATTAEHDWALDEARRRAGSDRTAAALARGRALAISEAPARAVELAAAAGG
jgi:tetratricopeptide (TPR) repeat protein